MAKLLEYNATLIERVTITPLLSTFVVELDEVSDRRPYFLPGQYTTIGLNNDDESELGSVRRAMSIASSPEQGPRLEFYIRLVEDGSSDNPLTPLLWRLRKGDRLFCRPKCAGRFTLEHTVGSEDKRLKLCVAAGTGLAPFISMIRSEVHRSPDVNLDNYAILHASSYPVELGYRSELEKLSRNNRLRYFSSVSRPAETPEWRGDTGRVEAYFETDRIGSLEQRLSLHKGQLNPEFCAIFICGLKGTIESSIRHLLPRGFMPENRKLRHCLGIPDDLEPSLFYEQYDEHPFSDSGDDAAIVELKGQVAQHL